MGSDIKTIKYGKRKFCGWLIEDSETGTFSVEYWENEKPGSGRTRPVYTEAGAWNLAREQIKLELVRERNA